VEPAPHDKALQEFCKAKDAQYKRLKAPVEQLHRNLHEIQARVRHAQAAYYASCSESDPDSASDLRGSIANVYQSKKTARDFQLEYKEVVTAANASQRKLRADAGDKLLSELELLEHQRMELTKVSRTAGATHLMSMLNFTWCCYCFVAQQAMQLFVELTAGQLPTSIGSTQLASIVPAVDSINWSADVSNFIKKKSTGATCGALSSREYNPVRDIPPSMKSLAQLSASGGGPIMAGWLHKEGHLVKNWKKRWCVLWPLHFQEEAMAGPSLFYFDDSETDSCPKGTLSIFGASIGQPKKSRKGYPWLIRIDCAEKDEGEDGRSKLVLAAESEEDREVCTAFGSDYVAW
jgi:hypothetical protein